MKNFDAYARYYDLLYKDKEYRKEAGYIHRLLARDARRAPGSLLEVGCGTGKHAMAFAQKGYAVQGIDLSPGMLRDAKERCALSRDPRIRNISFKRADARTFDLGHTFDAVVSLFHVMSYQTSDDDLHNVFARVRRHLKRGGLFLFDCWYGPTVLRTGPSPRIKVFEDASVKIIRFAEPVIHPNANFVDVNYTIQVHDKVRDGHYEIKERHGMRYFFFPEVRSLFSSYDMELLYGYTWMTRKEPDFSSWCVCFGGRAR
jgi:SAM-dependent methyltransferase